MAQYIIQEESLTAIADAVRQVSGTTGGLTPSQMIEILNGIESGGALTAAEASTFGEVDAEYEYGILERVAGNKWNSTYTGGYEFIPTEDISVVGIYVWAYETSTYDVEAGIYDADGNLLASCSMAHSTEGTQALFNSPVNLIAGKNYTVAACVRKLQYGFVSGMTINPKITYVCGRNISGLELTYPTNTNTSVIYGIADIIIGEPETPAPNQYKVQLETMNDIANEVIRITGATAKMTTAQMITALQSITLQDKTVTPSAETQTVTPDDGYYALSSVTVEAITEDNEAVTEIVNDELGVIENGTY